MNRGSATWILLLALASCAAPERDIELSFAFGKALIPDSDVRFEQPGGTDVTFEGVSWDDRSFVNPAYYAGRVTWWFGPESPSGLSLDFTHAKGIVDTSDVAPVSGTISGNPVSGELPINSVLDSFELTHGLNFLTLNYMHRWLCDEGRDRGTCVLLRPYVGAGAGIAVPHVDATVQGQPTLEYQITGPAINVLAGLSAPLCGRVSIFTEYKLTWTDVDVDLEKDSSLETELWVHQLLLGLSLRL